jgi:GntR family transcriptional regulator
LSGKPPKAAKRTATDKVEQHLRGLIDEVVRRNDGDLRLPSRTAIKAELGVHGVAVHTAVLRLVAEGLIETRRGRAGMFARVAHRVRRDMIAGIQLEYVRAVSRDGDAGVGLFEQMTGEDPADVHVEWTYEKVTPPSWVADRLGVDPAGEVLLRTFVYTVRDQPHQVARSYLSLATAERARLRTPDDEQVGMGTIAHLMKAGMRVTGAMLEKFARTATPDERQALKLPPATSMLVVRRTLYTGRGKTRPAVEATETAVDGNSIVLVTSVELDAAAVKKEGRS